MKESVTDINKTKNFLSFFKSFLSYRQTVSQTQKKKGEKNQINKIINENGEITTKNTEIQNIMRPL